jgi:hypothetical protein
MATTEAITELLSEAEHHKELRKAVIASAVGTTDRGLRRDDPKSEPLSRDLLLDRRRSDFSLAAEFDDAVDRDAEELGRV